MLRFEGVLLDLGGVVYLGSQLLPGSRDALARLRKAGLPVRFLTNTTRTPRRALLDKLTAMGIEMREDELFTPAMAACRILADENLSPHLLVHPALEQDFAEPAGQGTRPALIIGDAADAFNYGTLNGAFRVLQDGAEFLALANNRAFRDADGKLHFSDKPPVEQSAEKIEVHTAQDKLTAQRLKNMRRQASQLGTPSEAGAAEREAKRREQELAAHCNEARQKMNALLTSTRRQVVNEQGEREFLGEEERQAQIRAVEAQIEKACR